MNRFYLRDGRNFVINPEMEDQPGVARQSKKAFLLTINPTDFTTDKQWTADAIRSLSTGLVEVTDNGKRASKTVLIQRLIDYTEAERQLMLLASAKVLENLSDCGYSPEYLLELMSKYDGKDLVDAVEQSLLTSGYANSTIAKTLMPDIVKTIRDRYVGDSSQIIADLRLRMRPYVKQTDNKTRAEVVENSYSRRPIYYPAIYDFCCKVADNPENYDWKELGVALGLLTGRRMAEVHGAATKFTVIDDHTLLFEGQLKTKNREDVKPYPIPVLYDAEKVVGIRNRLIEIGKGLYEPDRVNKSLSKEYSTRIRGDLSQVFERSGVEKFKDLRDVYAAKILESKPATMTDNAYLSRYMGHTEKDLNTANTYQKIYLTYDEEN